MLGFFFFLFMQAKSQPVLPVLISVASKTTLQSVCTKMGVIFLAQGFHVLHVSDGLYCELPTPTLTSILDSREPFSYLYSWWLNLTLISVIYVDLLLKMCPISSLPDRQSQYNVSFFSTDLCCACSVGAASWIHCLKQMPVVDFDLFIPPSMHTL